MKGLRYVSLHEDSGYGVAGRRVMCALRDAGVPLTWTPMVSGRGWGLGYESWDAPAVPGAGELAPLCNRPLACDTVILHTVPEYFPRWRERLERTSDGPRPLILGHTVWETDRLPRHWPALLREVDAVLVPSRWNAEVFAGAVPDRPIVRLPHPCDPGLVPGGAPREPGEPFRFYTIGTWTVRKALGLLVRAYLRAFTAGEPVELVIKTSPPDFTSPRGRIARRLLGSHPPAARALARITAGRADPPPIQLIDRPASARDIDDLHRRGDCFVSLCRAEGWGLGAFDAATLGNPVVMTGHGGQLDYLGEDAPHLVRSRPVAVRDPAADSYSPDQSWAEPDVEHAAARLREVFEDPARARRRAEELSARIRARYAPERVAGDLLRDIEKLRALRGARS